MIKLIEINDTQFDAFVLRAPTPALVMVTSPECIICKTMAERLREVSKDVGSKMLFLSLNINENKKWQDYQVRVIPTLLYFKSGALAARQDNFPDADEIRSQIAQLTSKAAPADAAHEDLCTVIDPEASVGASRRCRKR